MSAIKHGALALAFACVVSCAFGQTVVEQDAQEPLVYESQGVHVTAPAGWMMYTGTRRHPGILVVFSRLPLEAAAGDFSRIILKKERAAKRDPGSPLTKAYREAEVVELMKNYRGVARARVLDGPRLAGEGGLRYATVAFEVTEIRKENKTERLQTVRSREYVFYRDGCWYTLVCGASPEYFDHYQADFDKVAQSLGFDS